MKTVGQTFILISDNPFALLGKCMKLQVRQRTMILTDTVVSLLAKAR